MKAFFSFVFSLKTLIFLLCVGALAAGCYYLYTWWAAASAAGPGFRTEKVERRKLTATINATGTIEPEEVIDVGAQIAGQVLMFGKDPTDHSGAVLGATAATLSAAPLGQGPLLLTTALFPGVLKVRDVDYCTPVEEGTVLARIDDSVYAAHVSQMEAALKNAQANLDMQKANAWKAEQDLKRADRQIAGGAQSLAASDYDTFAAAVKTSAASVEVAEAAIAQAENNLKEAKINLGYCTITSPVKGVIIDRRVNVGQTVVSSLSAPSLFLIAKDLMRLQVWASVNEADIGNIHVGQEVTFTVDARPNETFPGTVQQIRYNATMTQNVVTYTVVVSTNNKVMETPAAVKVKTPSGRTLSSGNTELELMPYLTANLTFHVAERPDALLVPNSALRWRPQMPQVAPEYRTEYEQSLRRKGAASAPEEPTTGGAPDKTAKPHDHEGGSSHGIVWVEENGFVRPIRLTTGLTDGAMTEVVKVLKEGDTLDEGTPLVTGENQGKSASATTNPFAPPPIFRPQQPKKAD